MYSSTGLAVPQNSTLPSCWFTITGPLPASGYLISFVSELKKNTQPKGLSILAASAATNGSSDVLICRSLPETSVALNALNAFKNNYLYFLYRLYAIIPHVRPPILAAAAGVHKVDGGWVWLGGFGDRAGTGGHDPGRRVPPSVTYAGLARKANGWFEMTQGPRVNVQLTAIAAWIVRSCGTCWGSSRETAKLRRRGSEDVGRGAGSRAGESIE